MLDQAVILKREIRCLSLSDWGLIAVKIALKKAHSYADLSQTIKEMHRQ